MFLPSIITVLAFGFLLLKLSPSMRQRLLGYDLAFDLAITFGLAWLFGTNTISGLMTAITTGFLFSIAIYVVKHLGHYQRLTRTGMKFKWVTYEGNWRTSCGRAAAAGRRIIDGADNA
jgi:hypothetical protein